MAKEEFGGTEKEVMNIKVYNKTCIGCERFSKDIMLSYNSTEKPREIIDLFLTQEQAQTLLENLQQRIGDNVIITELG